MVVDAKDNQEKYFTVVLLSLAKHERLKRAEIKKAEQKLRLLMQVNNYFAAAGIAAALFTFLCFLAFLAGLAMSALGAVAAGAAGAAASAATAEKVTKAKAAATKAERSLLIFDVLYINL